MGFVASVNVGHVTPLEGAGKHIRTALVKSPMAGRVPVRSGGLDGDERGDPRAHGGPDHAVYAYAAENAAWWADQLGHSVPPGEMFGENLTTSGIAVDDARIGEQWRIGDGGCVLMVVGPRIACGSFSARMDDRSWAQRFDAARRPGAYLRVLAEGSVALGDPIEVEPGPANAPTVVDVLVAIETRDADVARAVLDLDVPAEKLKAWAERVV